LYYSHHINDFRLEVARKFGANAVINAKNNIPEELRKINNEYLADVVILCSGAKQAVVSALESVERGGTILIFAATESGLKFESSISFKLDKCFFNTIHVNPYLLFQKDKQ